MTDHPQRILDPTTERTLAMFTQERTPMANLIVGGPIPTNSYDNSIVAALIESRPVMLIHALNGGYLTPNNLTSNDHTGGAATKKVLDVDTKNARGHLWYITPGGYFGQRPLYFIESAAGETLTKPDEEPRGDDGKPKPTRKRITIHRDTPTQPVCIGLPDKVNPEYQGKNGAPEDTQLWIITVTPWGGITFVPITHPETILGFQDHNFNFAAGDNTDPPSPVICPTTNWGGDFTGSVINTYYPRLPNEWAVPYHHVFT
jgi:hypothetical protein